MKGLRVLIIEDEPLIALLYEDVLSELGHEVCASEYTQAGAIAAASCHRPDLIIADMRLNEGSGIDALKAILTTGFVPHVFVSGDRLALTQADTAAVTLQKPFNERQLVKAISSAMDPANVLIGEKLAHSSRTPDPQVE